MIPASSSGVRPALNFAAHLLFRCQREADTPLFGRGSGCRLEPDPVEAERRRAYARGVL